jgi:DNA-directed RNA polymerase subunit RPC12/RpoP
MTEPGYKCHECGRTFADYQGCGPVDRAHPRCPTCGSADVNVVELHEEWVSVLRSSPCFG